MKIGELVSATKAIIMKMYLDESDERDWALAFSGGKDSTAALGLIVSVIESLPVEKRIRKVHGVMSDTVVENPLVHDHMNHQANAVNKYCRKNLLPVSMQKVNRDIQNSYFMKILGLGYFLPMRNGKGRWCTSHLKIRPQNRYLKEINPSFIVTGVRHAESAMRSKSIDKWQVSEFIGNHADLRKSQTFNPIVNWTVQDVWKYLEMEGISWGSTLSVRTIYKDATGECGFTNPEGTEKAGVEVCGARHGCWLCPVILKDRSTEKMSEKHAWMEPLTEWRITQLRVYGNYSKAGKDVNSRVKSVTKSGFRRDGKALEVGQGTLTVHAREYLLQQLIETQSLVNRMRSWDKLEPISLISEDEISLIQKQWADDKLNRPYLVGSPLNEIKALLEGEQ